MAVCGRWTDIPFKRVRETTYPRRHHLPQRMMAQAMAARTARVSRKLGKSRAALTITHPNAAGIDIGSAAALRTSQSALGAYFRRMCSRMDKPKAVTAAAHKLARLIYTRLTQGEDYTDQGQDYYDQRYRERALRNLSQRSQTLGMQLAAAAYPTRN